MLRRVRNPIFVLTAGLVLALPAGAQSARSMQASLADTLLASDTTREQLAMDLIGALGLVGFQPLDCVPGDELFDDVPASSTFCSFIEEVARRGITTGCDDGNFCPGSTISRQQMAVFVVRALEANRTASAFAQSEEQVVLAPDSATVLETSITVPAGGRTVNAFATLDVFAADPNGGANCRITIGDSVGMNQFSRAGNTIRQNLALVHSHSLAAGTHPVTVECAQAFSGTAAVQNRAINVVATN